MKKIFLIVPVTKIMVMVLFAFVLLLPLSARAQVKGGSFEVSPFVGYNFFESGQNVKNNFVYGGRLGYNFTKYFGIEATGEYIHSRVDDRSITTVKEGRFTGPSDNVDIGFYHLDAIVHFMPDSRFTPFIVAGVGGAHYYPKISDKDMFTIDVGVGAKFWLTEHIALRVDVRDNMATEVFQETYHNISATAGIVFAFGGRKSAPAPALAMKSEPEPEAKSETIIVEKAEKVVVLASEPKVEETVTVLASEPKEKVIILAFEDVHFDFDKSTLKPETKVILKRSIQILKDNPKAKIRIAGYTSASGTEEYNQKLSERRAKAVEDYLIEEGVIKPERLSIIGYGKTRPAEHEAAPKDLYSKAAKANMRVLFEVIVQ